MSLARTWPGLCVAWILLQAGAAAGQVSDLSRGGLIGRVFYDLDGDGTWSPGDRGLAGVRILTSGGLLLISGPAGGFHAFLLDTGFDVGGEHVLVLDRSTLVAGAEVTGGPRRRVVLQPAMLARVDYPVRPPALRLAERRGIIPAGDRVPARLEPGPGGTLETWLAGEVPSGCEIEVDAQPVELDGDRIFRRSVSLRPGVTPHLLTLHCDDGHLEFLLAEMHWLRRRRGGDLVVPGRLRTVAVCAGPPARELSRVRALDVVCRTEPGIALSLGGPDAEASAAGPGLTRHRLMVHPGDNAIGVRLRVGTESPHSSTLRWHVSPVRVLAASHGQVVLGLPLGSGGRDLTWAGSLGGSLVADLPEDLQLILGTGLETADSEGIGKKEWARRTLSPDRDPTVLGRAPDPERGPVATADGGQVRSLNPGGSRYFLGLRRKSSWLGWGAFALDQNQDDQPGQVRRSLHGAQVGLRPLEDWFPGPDPALDLQLAGFFAQTESAEPLAGPGSGWTGRALQLPAHEEFTSTGGTLFFLAHPWLVEGSVRVSAERRDRFSGAVMDRRVLRPGLDVDVDWLSGRLLLREPLGQFSSAGALRMNPLGDGATVLVVDYEYLSSGQDGPASLFGGSARLSGKPADALRLQASVSTVRSRRAEEGSGHDLLRTRVEGRWADWARIWASWAESRGRLLAPAFSLDGGISFEALTLPDREAGESWEAGIALGTDRLSGRAVFRRQREGFSDSLRLVAQDLNQASVRLESQPIPELHLKARFTGNEFGDSRLLEGRLGLAWRVSRPLLLELDGGYQGGHGTAEDAREAAWTGGGQRALVGLRLGWDVGEWITLLVGHQHSLYTSGQGWTARDLTLSTAGARVRVFDDLALQTEAGWGPEVGTVLRLGASQADEDGRATFAHTTFSIDGADPGEGAYTAGQSAPVGGGCLLSSSQTLGQTGAGDLIGQRIAFDAPIERDWRLHLAYERAELHHAGRAEDRDALFVHPFIDRGVAPGGGPGRRNAVFARLAYLGPRLALSASGEYRVDEQWPLELALRPDQPDPIHHRQTVVTLAGRYRPLRGLALSARLAWAETFGRNAGSDGAGWPEGGLLQASFGLAYRPAAVEWLRLLLRAAAGADHRPPSAGLWPERNGQGSWFLTSLAAVLTPSPYFQPTLVVAPWWRILPDASGGETYRKFQMLGALRLGSEVWGGLGLAGEMRMSMLERNYGLLPAGDDEGTRLGAACELFYHLEGEDVGALRFSVGYSFSDLPDPVMTDLRMGRQGLYLRLEGLY